MVKRQQETETSLTFTILSNFFCKIWVSEYMLEDWNTGLIVRLQKQEDPSDCNIWRGVTLSSLTGKVFSKMILELFTGNLRKGYY